MAEYVQSASDKCKACGGVGFKSKNCRICS